MFYALAVERGQRRQQAQVLRPDLAKDQFVVGRIEPPAALAWCVDYLWWVCWDTEVVFTQNVIPRPVVHVAAEMWDGEPRLLVHGPSSVLFERRLDGVGRTVAAAFRPGGFRPFITVDVADMTDQVVMADEVFDVDDRMIAGRLLDPALPVDAAANELADLLGALEPQPDPIVERVAGLVERAEQDRSIVRTSQLAGLAGVSERTLQRRFQSYVGAAPKAVVQRFRLLDVASASNAGDDVDWAALAVSLGYSDQSHLIRQFKAVTGESPDQYSRQKTVG